MVENEIESVLMTEPYYPEPEKVQKRDRTQITADILRVCLSGAMRTQIVYQANLNFKVLVRYLARLLSANLLDSVGRYYYTTEAGKEYMYHAERLVI